jgi:hypothetical protein
LKFLLLLAGESRTAQPVERKLGGDGA